MRHSAPSIFLGSLLLAVLPLAAAEPSGGAGAEPTVTPARAEGAPYGPLWPAHSIGHRADNPEARHEWFLRQRAYPFADLPVASYATASDAYVAGRAATLQRNLQKGASPNGTNALPTGPWGEVGPAPINPSPFAFGPVTGRISAVALHPTNNNIVLIGGSWGGIWRTADNGGTWSPVGDGQTTLAIADIKFAPSNGSIAYAATGDDDKGWWGRGVLKSTDAGLTWSRVGAATLLDGVVLSKLTVDPTNANVVVVSSNGNKTSTGSYFVDYIYRSTDGGATWVKATIPTDFGGNVSTWRTLVIEPNCPANLWVFDTLAGSQEIRRSTNGGANWATVAAAGLPVSTGNAKIAVQSAGCAGPRTIYVSVQSGDGLAGSSQYPGVYRSTDSGANFALPGTPGPSGGCLAQCSYDHELIVDPGDGARVYMLGRDIWTSTNSGATWTNRSAGFDDSNNYFGGNMHVDLHDVAIRGTGGTAVVYVAGDGGLWSYDVAGNSFTNRNGNLAISEFMDLAIDPDTADRAVGGLQDNGTVAWTGTSVWPTRLGGDGGDSGWLRTTPGAGNPFDGAFTTYIQNIGYQSTNAAVNWTNYNVWSSDAAFSNESAEFYAPWIGTVGNNRVWHGAQSLWYRDFPANCPTPASCSGGWTKMGTTNLAALGGGSYVSKLAIHNPSAGVLGPFYASTAYNRAFLQSADGLTWNNRTGTLPNRYISDITFNPASPAQVWVALQGFGTGHVWYSPDGGQTWQDKSGTLPNVPVNDILVDPLDISLTWYVGTDIGVYGTADGGATWSVVGNNFPAVQVNDLELDANRMLYAATGGRSAWRIQLPGSVCSWAGLQSVTNNSTSTCRLDLAWTAASAPCGSPARYNIYRSTTPGALGSRIGACITGTSYSDQSAASGTAYYYTVRLETGSGGIGPCLGAEESNLTQVSGSAGGTGTFTLFSETAESGTGLNNWTPGIFTGGNSAADWRGIESCVNRTPAGSKDFRYGGAGCTGAYAENRWAFAMPGSAGILTVPAGATNVRLNFWHQYDFEGSYDGAHLFINIPSINATLYSIADPAFLAGGYNGTLIEDATFCTFNRPGGVGWRIWTSAQASFMNTIVNLDAACNGVPGNTGGCAGKNIKIAFTANTDCAGNQTGWFLDDVTVTYDAAASCTPAARPPEVSGGATPLRLSKSGGNLGFSWADQALVPQDYNIYQGTAGTWYGHSLFACHLTTPQITCASGTCSVSGLTPAAGSRYYFMTSSGPGGESNAGATGWNGPNHTTAPVYTVPAACGGN